MTAAGAITTTTTTTTTTATTTTTTTSHYQAYVSLVVRLVPDLPVPPALTA